VEKGFARDMTPDFTQDAAPPVADGEQLARLVAVATAAAAGRRLDEILEAACAQTRVVLGSASVAIARWEGGPAVCVPVAAEPAAAAGEILVGPALAEALAAGSGVAIGTETDGAAGDELRIALGGTGGLAPILHAGRPWGLLAARDGSGELSAPDLELLLSVASVLAGAIDRGELFDRLERFAFEDPLTGLANRRALDDRLAAAIAEATKRSPVVLMMCDVDGFKELNDDAGHDAGDRILQHLARVLVEATVRHPRSLVARVGGDEFCVVLEGESLRTAELIARTAAAAIAADRDAEVTLAWGAAATEAPLAPTELYRRADAAQYTAKRLGPGRICIDRAELAPAPAPARGRRRVRRDAWAPGAAIVVEAIEILDKLPPEAGVIDRLEATTSALSHTLDAAGWSISRMAAGDDLIQTVRGFESRLDSESGARVVDVAADEPYPVADYPATARAMAEGTGFRVRLDEPGADAAECAVVRGLGYEEMIAAAATDADGSYLVEVYGDGNTPGLEPALVALRLLVTQAVARSGGPARRSDELAAARERFETAFENASIGMALVDLSGRFLQVNRALCCLVGRDREHLITSDFQSITHPADLQADISLLEATLAGERDGYHIDKRYLRPDGSAVWAALHMTLVRDGGGDPSYFISQIEDISERKHTEEELIRRADDLRALSGAAPHAPRPEHAAGDQTETPVLVERVLDLCRSQLGMEAACLTRIDGELAHVEAAVGPMEALGVAAGATPDSRIAICRLVVDGTSHPVIPDTQADPSVRELEQAGLVRAYAGSPVRVGGEVYGTLCCLDRRPRPALGARHAELLDALATLLGAQLEHDQRRAVQSREHAGLTGVYALVAALEARDRYTGAHSRTVVSLARMVAERIGLGAAEIELATQVALLHDMGKVAIPDSVLQKPGPLSEAEWDLMRQHPAVGATILSTIPELAHLASAVRAEHERWDGAGYPDGLAGAAIPLAARITLACDAYDAMTNDRPYRRARTAAEARAELRAHSGTQFDPEVVAALEAVLDAGQLA
jgi:diguanylate cyclase (GGDEF)-like protein/PAS domain S-box-containing protein